MKKFLKTGKKALSVFMAVLMVMTAWVFVAPEKASAATAGSYYVEIALTVGGKGLDDGTDTDYVGKTNSSTTAASDCCGLSLFYKTNNGTASSESEYYWDLYDGTAKDGNGSFSGGSCKSTGAHTASVTIPGYPTGIYLLWNDSRTMFGSSSCTVTSITVSNPDKTTGKTVIWTGSIYCNSSNQAKYVSYNLPNTGSGNGNDSSNANWSTSTVNWNKPTATSVRFISGESSIATPKTGATDASKVYEAGVYDQYSVRMTYDPTLVLRSTAPTSKQTSNSSIAGVSLGSSSNSKATLTVNSNAQLGTLGENSKTFYIHAYYGSLFTSGTTDDAANNKYANKAVTITDPKYRVKYYLNNGTSLSTDTNPDNGLVPAISSGYYYYDVYYGETIKSQGTIDNKNSYPKYGTRSGHTFKGMFTLPNSTTPMDINEQITSDKIYYAQWDKNTYTVVYLDRMNQKVVYVDNVKYQAASNSNAAKEQLNATEYDTINHYLLNTSNPWTIVSGSSNLTSITGNTFVRANYNSGEHTFGDPVDVAATCQHKAGKKYTCSVCGYSYVQETGTTGGDHVESTDYIVDTPATCQATGTKHKYCTVCGESKTAETIAKIPHAYNSTPTNATCIATGSINYTCAVCGATASTTLPKTAHNFVAGTPVAATCTSSGYTPYTCSTSGCTASYNSYDSTKPATAHTWEVYAQSEGSVTLKCTPCGATKTITVDADLTGHDFSGVTAAIETAPTCAAAGTATLACKKTGCTKTISITIPKLTNSHTSVTTTYTAVNGHTNGSIVTKCTTCNTTLSTTTIEAPADCVFINNGTATEPTCTTAGSQPTKCIYCNATSSITIPATGHKTVTVAATCGARGYVKCAVCDLELSSTDPTGAHIAATTPLVDIPATCTEDGLYIVCCKNCNAVMENTPRPATDHTWGNWETVIEPICGVKGIERRSCSVCHAIENRDKAAYAADHTDGDQVVVADVPASCTAAGKYVVKCSICNDTIINEVRQPLGHNFSNISVTDPTCNEAGFTTYTCVNPGCTTSYVDNYVSPTPHNMVVDDAASAPATCESRGYNKKVCQNYGCSYYSYEIIPMLDHAYTPMTPVPATCIEGGYTTYRCSRCGKSYKDDFVDPTGHSYNEGTVIREATEASPIGVIEYVCTICNSKIYEEYVLDATDHVWSPDETFDATCTTEGTIKYKCIKPNCQACADANASPVTFTKVIPALGHNMDDGVYLSEEAKPTCTEPGTLTFSCQRAGCTYSYDVEVDATGHSYPTSKVKAPTCTEEGYTEYTCDVCNYTMKDNFVNSLGHNEITTVIAPTCVKSGYTIVECSRCNYIYIGEESITDPTGHTEYLKSHNDPTCTQTGSKTYGCMNCTEYERTEEVPATGHIYDDVPVDATCTTPGYIIYTCIHGDDTYNKLVCAPTPHPFGEWVIEKAQTNTEPGMKVRTCPVCDLSEHEVIPMDGHVWDDGTVINPPKCTETGEMEFKCTVAGCPACDALGELASYIQIIPATGHNVVAERTEPTCSQKGKITYNCQNAECDYKAFEDVEIATIAHTWSEGFYKEEDDKPTCQKSGILTYKCTECNEAATTEVVSMLPHDYIVVHTDPTCVTVGYNTYTCSGCGLCYTISLPGTEPKLGHTFTELVRHEDPTCEAEGFTINKCVRCDETNTEVIAATGHDWTDWEVTIEAGCSTPGLETRYCRNNPTEHIQKNTLTATGLHRWVKTVCEPTCTQMGFTIFSCKTCELVKRGEFIPSLGHNLDAGVYHPATCTKDGGTLYTCQREGCTFKYFKKDADALGHSMSQYEYVVHPTDPNAYAKERRCTRTGCTFTEYEKTAGIVNKYYKVEFINEWVTDTHEYLDATPDFTPGTPLAKTYKTVILETTYVREGGEATYTGTTPFREKDRDYGIYEFTGWDLDVASASLSEVTTNIKATATFAAGDMYYYVVFQNPINGKHYSPEYKVLHGHPITYTQAEPGMFSNNHYRYIFDHWDRDLSHIYSSGGINAMFNMVPDETTIVYHDWNGTRLGSEVVQYHQAAQNAPTNLTRPADSTYIYEFSGKWTLSGGEEFDLTCPEFANGTESIDVYARYYQKFVDYRVTIQVFDADAHLVPNAPVQILDSRGQLAYTGYTNEEGSLTITVRYDTIYTAQVTDSLGGAVQATFTVPRNTPVKLQYEDNRDYEHSDCKCICHSFLGGMWITMLNILYKLFKLKHVCCYDMFATHGDKLAYTK